jgi:hypothetical protein
MSWRRWDVVKSTFLRPAFDAAEGALADVQRGGDFAAV